MSTEMQSSNTGVSIINEDFPQVIKRDGAIVPFDINKVSWAIQRCLRSLDLNTKENLLKVVNDVKSRLKNLYVNAFSVEKIQDIVQESLYDLGFETAATQYVLYRLNRSEVRDITLSRSVPETVKKAFEDSAKYFPTPLQLFQYYDKYARFDYDLGRRETWIETVDRTVSFLKELSQNKLSDFDYGRIKKGLLNQEVAGSMRLLATAGPSARKNNISIYNCSYLEIDCLEAFIELMIIGSYGAGIGYSVSRECVNKLPFVEFQKNNEKLFHVIDDTSEGWAEALKIGLEAWFSGDDIIFDYSLLRPASAPLRTKTGRSSGPTPLLELLEFARIRILQKQGQKLTPLNAHDICCAIGTATIQGGHRRIALISLFDADDEEMRNCKNGNFEIENKQRWNANNSAIWPDTGITQNELIQQMNDMFDGERGEPGICSREAIKHTLPTRREYKKGMGLNPCGEIILRPMQFCNLSQAIIREWDTLETLLEKVELSCLIGTIQSMGVHFPGLRPDWAKNCTEERLLGCDLAGYFDNPITQNPEVLIKLRQKVRETNVKYAKLLGINESKSDTCLKPSGNSSLQYNVSSGCHPRHSEFYIRNARVTANSTLYKVLKSAGVPMVPENGQTEENARTWVIPFPVKAPKNAVFRKDLTFKKHAEIWLNVKKYWTEHNPSVSFSYREEEKQDVIDWTWENRQYIGGVSYIPYDNAKYNNMPYVEITEEEYNIRIKEFPEIDFSKIYEFEDKDYTTVAGELACQGGACLI